MATVKQKCCSNVTKGIALAPQLREAYSFIDRLRGLLFKPQLAPGEGLRIEPCNSIHMLGMQYAIDVVFYDRSGKVVALVPDIHPLQISQVFPRAHGCIELLSGTIAATGTECGDQLAFE